MVYPLAELEANRVSRFPRIAAITGKPMDTRETDFLPTMIGILERLHATSLKRGQANLAVLLDLARSEAEDVLRTAGQRAHVQAASRMARREAN
jgi:hypothetical protein